MKHLICTIFDTKAKLCNGVNIARTKADFVRSVQVETKRPDSMLHQFPADYDLVILGEIDITTGEILYKQERLGSVLDLCPTA